MLLKCLFEVIRMEIILILFFFGLFFMGVKCHKDQLKVHFRSRLGFNVVGSSILAFKVTVQVKKTLIGPNPNLKP